MSIPLDLVRGTCGGRPGFDDGSAYVKTKICCQVLTELGESVPSWTALREIIGKGSAGDISRGVKDFRKEHAETLRSMNGIVPGVPEPLWPFIRGMWENAVVIARGEFSDQTEQWEKQIEQAHTRADQADIAASDALAMADKCNGELATAQATNVGLEKLMETERAARIQAERMFEINAEEVRSQRIKLEDMLRQNKIELAAAFERFDGERKHSLQQIEEARASAARQVSVITSQAQREAGERELEIAGLRNSLSELRATTNAADKRSALIAQEAADLRARLLSAESQAQQLASDNRRLVELLQGRSSKPATSRAHAPKSIRKNRGTLK